MIVSRFWENVDTPEGGSQRLEFTPKDGSGHAGGLLVVTLDWTQRVSTRTCCPSLHNGRARSLRLRPLATTARWINIKPEHVEPGLIRRATCRPCTPSSMTSSTSYYEHPTGEGCLDEQIHVRYSRPGRGRRVCKSIEADSLAEANAKFGLCWSRN